MSSSTTEEVLTFVVERFDSRGDRRMSVPVEMVGTINGVLRDGGEGRIDAAWSEGEELSPRIVYNVTTGARIELRRSFGGLIAFVVFVVLVIVAITILFQTGRD